MRQIVVFVPDLAEASSLHIARGSGIIGEPKPARRLVLIYFEGATERPPNLSSFADRVLAVYRQMCTAKPRLSRAVVPVRGLLAIGTFDTHRREVILTGRESERDLARWLGVRRVEPTQLHACRR